MPRLFGANSSMLLYQQAACSCHGCMPCCAYHVMFAAALAPLMLVAASSRPPPSRPLLAGVTVRGVGRRPDVPPCCCCGAWRWAVTPAGRGRASLQAAAPGVLPTCMAACLLLLTTGGGQAGDEVTFHLRESNMLSSCSHAMYSLKETTPFSSVSSCTSNSSSVNSVLLTICRRKSSFANSGHSCSEISPARFVSCL